MLPKLAWLTSWTWKLSRLESRVSSARRSGGWIPAAPDCGGIWVGPALAATLTTAVVGCGTGVEAPEGTMVAPAVGGWAGVGEAFGEADWQAARPSPRARSIDRHRLLVIGIASPLHETWRAIADPRGTNRCGVPSGYRHRS